VLELVCEVRGLLDLFVTENKTGPSIPKFAWSYTPPAKQTYTGFSCVPALVSSELRRALLFCVGVSVLFVVQCEEANRNWVRRKKITLYIGGGLKRAEEPPFLLPKTEKFGNHQNVTAIITLVRDSLYRCGSESRTKVSVIHRTSNCLENALKEAFISRL
jgi:hypothetical protein